MALFKVESNNTVTTVDHSKKMQHTSTQKSIPIIAGYEDGMIQSEPGVFSKCYEIPEANFKTLSDDDQEVFFEKYQTFLNSIESNEHVTFNLFNTLDDIETQLDKVSLKERNDDLDPYRREMNQILSDKMHQSRGSIVTRRFLTYSITDGSEDNADRRFKDIDIRVETEIRNFLHQEIKPLSLDARLELLMQIYGTDDSVYLSHDADGTPKVDLKSAGKFGLDIRDVIAPTFMQFNQSNFQIDQQQCQTLFLNSIANFMSTDFIGDLMAVNSKMLISLDINSLDQGDAIKLVHNKQVMVDGELTEKQKQAVKQGYSPELVSADLEEIRDQIRQLQKDMTSRDQRVFYFQMHLTMFANSKDELKRTYTEIKSVANKNLCGFRTEVAMQERGFDACLPLGVNTAKSKKRLMPTENLAAFLPFTETSTFDHNGIYYGINSINKSVIVLDRTTGQNYNGLILGTPGSGKSFAAKMNLINIILNTNADVFVIDPDGEYAPIVKALHGSEIRIAPGNNVHLNPFDLDMDTTYDKENSPLAQQADFIASICETINGGGSSQAHSYLTTQQKSILNKCTTQLYSSYLEHLRTMPPDPVTGQTPTIDINASPTLQDLWDMLLHTNNIEAQDLALAMELYTTGEYDTFAHRTNVDINNRLTVFNIQNIGTNLRELGLKVCLQTAWNHAVENRAKNKWTYIFIDEFHMLMSSPTSSEFIKTLWKRARKFWTSPTGITQNVEDLLLSPDARAVINNSQFVMMLNQSSMDRQQLQQILELSDNETQYINNVDSGRGLIHFGSRNIPFENDFPKNTDLYKLMSTKAGEI